VDAHGVEIFDGADDDAVAGLIAHPKERARRPRVRRAARRAVGV
jgi:hypothetical protein